EHWPNEGALGKSVVLMDRRPPVTATVIGVVEDIRNHALKSEPVPTIYLNEGLRLREALVRTSAPSETIEAVKGSVREIDPTQTFQFVWSIDDRLFEQNGELRFYMCLLSAFAGLALILALVGLYSVAAQAAVRRTQEIGLRMAVGAGRGQILLMIA